MEFSKYIFNKMEQLILTTSLDLFNKTRKWFIFYSKILTNNFNYYTENLNPETKYICLVILIVFASLVIFTLIYYRRKFRSFYVNMLIIFFYLLTTFKFHNSLLISIFYLSFSSLLAHLLYITNYFMKVREKKK